MKLLLLCAIAIAHSGLAATAPAGDDWPAFRHDTARSGRTTESLDAQRLQPDWTWESVAPPAAAWPGPAKWDAWASLRGLRSMRNYDSALHPIAVADSVFLGSNVDDSVHCLDAATGQEKWAFTAGGPIRIAPTHHEGKLYFGADDGYAYCIDAETGTLVWKFSPTPHTERRVLNDGNLISFWPIRTGIAITDGTAYFGASFMPWKPSYLCAVDANTGKPEGDNRFIRDLGLEHTLEGAILTSSDSIVVPQGRVAPMIFARADGAPQGPLPGGGGAFCLLTDDNRVVHGPGNKAGWITDSDAQSRTQVASYDRGTALVVSGDISYLLRPDALAAINRKTQTPLWATECNYPHAMILAGDTLYLGGDDAVAAFDAGTGDIIWTAPVRGRAMGLAVAQGRLLVSTDEGQIVAFSEGDRDRPLARTPGTQQATSPTIPNFRDRDLLDRWVFQRNALGGDGVAPNIDNRARRLPAQTLGLPKFTVTGDVESILLDGTNGGFTAADDFTQANLPARAITAEAWVRVDAPIEWGGIVGAIQDNGSYERGWILGFRGSRFGFALVGEAGGDGMTWLTAPADFTPGAWHHVVGTYDGAIMRLFVDGKPAGTSTAERGDIFYPDAARYHLGAYRDDDEHFPMTGMLHEIRVYSRTLDPAEIADHHADAASRFPRPEPPALAEATDHPAIGPYLVFDSPTTAIVRWTTAKPCPTKLVFIRDGKPETLDNSKLKTEHQVLVTDLRPDHVYSYRVHYTDGAGLSPEYECDLSFNYTREPLALPPHQTDPRTAAILQATSTDQGYAVVLAPRDAASLANFADSTRFQVLAFETDPARVETLRRELLAERVYGHRVTVAHVADLATLPTPDAFANVVVLGDRVINAPIEVVGEIGRIVAPSGGIAVLGAFDPGSATLATTLDAGDLHGCQFTASTHGGFTIFSKGEIEGAAPWTHMYGLPDNTAYAGEQLAGVDSTEDLAANWIGRPGPRYQSDRGNRKPSPLATNGRLFMQGLNRIIAVDAYNGTILWSVEVPTLQRFNIPRDTSNWCADDDFVYFAAQQHVWVLDAATGTVVTQHAVTSPEGRAWLSEWGYLASFDDMLIGTAVKEDSTFTNWWGSESWYDAKDGDNARKTVSDNIFAIQKSTGSPIWKYQNGLIVNSTITLTDNTFFFVETRDPALVAADTRQLDGDAFWDSQKIVALDANTGRPLWEQPIDTLDGVSAFYLAGSEGVLVIVASQGGNFGIYGFDAKTGTPIWDKELPWEVDHHGKHLSRQAIVGGRVIVRPYVLDLFTGEQLPFAFPVGHQCGTYTCSESALFLRAGNLTVWSQEDDAASSWNRLRPDCWISTIPANGMLLSPEGGGGCSCGSWIEVSVGLLPIAK